MRKQERQASDLVTSEGPRKSASSRPTSWWLQILRNRAARMHDEYLDLSRPLEFQSDEEQRAAIKFFNAAFRAEESGLRQAHELAEEVDRWDPELGEVLRLYGSEEGWHQELITKFLDYLGGEIQPMGRVTRTFYRLYGKAKHMETIVLVNLMFETIGATTYRMALRSVSYPAARQMLTILTRDESFHVPLNVHFLRQVLAKYPERKKRLRPLFYLLFASLVALPLASRPKAKAFDGLSVLKLSRGYAEQLATLFLSEPELGLTPPRFLLRLLGLRPSDLIRKEGHGVASLRAAELAADRDRVEVAAL